MFSGAYSDVLKTYSDVLELELYELELHAIFFIKFQNTTIGSLKIPL